MYISEFVCGVAATLIAEFVLLFIYAFYDRSKKK